MARRIQFPERTRRHNPGRPSRDVTTKKWASEPLVASSSAAVRAPTPPSSKLNSNCVAAESQTSLSTWAGTRPAAPRASRRRRNSVRSSLYSPAAARLKPDLGYDSAMWWYPRPGTNVREKLERRSRRRFRSAWLMRVTVRGSRVQSGQQQSRRRTRHALRRRPTRQRERMR